MSTPQINDVAIMSVLNSRYTSCWSEINTRIAQRQLIIQSYLIIFSASISTAFIPFHPNLYKVLYFVPLLSFFFIRLIEMHEIQIAILRSFLSEIEESVSEYIHSRTTQDKGTTSTIEVEHFNIPVFYHPNSNKMELSEQRRVFHDKICFWLIVVTTCISGMIIIIKTGAFNSSLGTIIAKIKSDSFIEILSLLVGLIALLYALRIAKRIKIEREDYFLKARNPIQ